MGWGTGSCMLEALIVACSLIAACSMHWWLPAQCIDGCLLGALMAACLGHWWLPAWGIDSCLLGALIAVCSRHWQLHAPLQIWGIDGCLLGALIAVCSRHWWLHARALMAACSMHWWLHAQCINGSACSSHPFHRSWYLFVFHQSMTKVRVHSRHTPCLVVTINSGLNAIKNIPCLCIFGLYDM